MTEREIVETARLYANDQQHIVDERLINRLCDTIDRLTRDLDLARAEADRLQSYRETWERTRMSWEKENERMRAALINITKLDQLEKRTCIDFDPAGCTYEIEMIDGPCAHIARRVLEQSTAIDEGALADELDEVERVPDGWLPDGSWKP